MGHPQNSLYTIKPIDEPLSRRDRFAMAALAGLLSSAGPRDKVEDAAFVAVKAADLTIAELDKEK